LRTLSPDAAFRSSSPSPSTPHKRRKSSCSSSDLGDRRPRKGDEDYIKRPENAFILFRRKCCEDRQAALEEATSPSKKQRQADLSKTISQQWKSLSVDERQYWEHLAKEKKKEHELKYPDYVYRPQRAKDKDGRPKPRKHKRGDVEEEADNITVGVPNVHHQRHHGRSLSAPTPPPYQTIQIPNVYQMTPSCPTSPSLLPMISRRSSHPDYAEDPLSQFDYIPNDNFSFGQAGQLEASLQSSEFLRSIFSMSNTSEPLHPLEISSESMLLPPLGIVSPSSSISSGPSSPTSDPFSPHSALLLQPFARLTTSDVSEQQQQPAPTQAELDLQMELQLQHEYAGYAWETSSLWPTDSELLLSDDFNLGAIPPIELGVPKYQDHLALPELGFGQSFQFPEESQVLGGILAFDELMGARGF